MVNLDPLDQIDGEGTMRSIVDLGPGRTYTRAVFLPAYAIGEGTIRDTKRRLTSSLTQAVARASRSTANRYTMHAIQSFTHGYDVIVAVVIFRELDEDEDDL